MDLCHKCKKNSPTELNSTVTCSKCNSVIHLSCLDHKPITHLKGDNFFTYKCYDCNGNVLMERITLPWLTIVQLSLYNLSIEDKGCKGYYRFRDICTFIDQNWTVLAPDKLRTTNWRSTTAGVLSTYCPQVFTSGQRQCNMPGWWALVKLQPPPPPNQTRTHLKGSAKLKRKIEEVKDHLPTGNGNSENVKALRIKNISCNEKVINKKKIKTEPEIAIKKEPVDKEYIKKEQCVVPPAFNDIFTTDLNEFEAIKGMENPTMDLDFNSVWSENNHATGVSTVKTETPSLVDKEMPEDEDKIKSKSEHVDNENYEEEKKKPSTSKRKKDDKMETIVEMRFLTDREERSLVSKMKEDVTSMADAKVRRYIRKLKLRILKRSVGLPLFNLDTTVRNNIEKVLPRDARIVSNVHTISGNSEETISQGGPTNPTPGYTHPALRGVNILDRFKSLSIRRQGHTAERHLSFMSKLCGSDIDLFTKSICSPYTSRVLKPYIRRDTETIPPKVKLLIDITTAAAKRYTQIDSNFYKRGSIDYCYVQPLHIPIVNAMCNEFFWPGIDLSECLQYPDFSCIVMYKRLVIGFGFMVPDVKYNEAYISFILVHPDWQHCGIGSFIIYHLIQTCMGKDVTLHVSADNPSMLLYQKFGFKTEGFLLDFYDKYFPPTSRDCKHAFFLRLQR